MREKTKQIMTTKEVAEYLHVHPLTVSKHAREGKIPGFKIGADWRFHRKHIDRWIQEKLESQAHSSDARKMSGRS